LLRGQAQVLWTRVQSNSWRPRPGATRSRRASGFYRPWRFPARATAS